MKIPYLNYELTIPRETIFSFMIALVYAFVAFPEINKFIGSHLYLEDYDDVTSNDRYYLLMIHSVVMGLLTYLLLMIYNPSSHGITK